MKKELSQSLTAENNAEPRSRIEIALEKASQGKKYKNWPEEAKEHMLKSLAEILKIVEFLNNGDWKNTHGEALIINLENRLRKSGRTIGEGSGRKYDHYLFSPINRELYERFHIRTTQTPRTVFTDAVSLLRTGKFKESPTQHDSPNPKVNSKTMRKSERPPGENPFNR